MWRTLAYVMCVEAMYVTFRRRRLLPVLWKHVLIRRCRNTKAESRKWTTKESKSQRTSCGQELNFNSIKPLTSEVLLFFLLNWTSALQCCYCIFFILNSDAYWMLHEPCRSNTSTPIPIPPQIVHCHTLMPLDLTVRSRLSGMDSSSVCVCSCVLNELVHFGPNSECLWERCLLVYTYMAKFLSLK